MKRIIKGTISVVVLLLAGGIYFSSSHEPVQEAKAVSYAYTVGADYPMAPSSTEPEKTRNETIKEKGSIATGILSILGLISSVTGVTVKDVFRKLYRRKK